MSVWSAIRVALEALLVNKGRSALTSLGIVIGISAVIAMVSAGSGAREKLEERLDSVGKNLILIRPGARTQMGTVGDYSTLSREDSEAIAKDASDLLLGVASEQITQRVVVSPGGRSFTMICGVEPGLQGVRGWQLAAGRFINDDDMKKTAAVCLLGQTTSRKLFPNNPNPLGEWVRIENLRLRVVGLLAEKGRAPTGADQDDQIFLPLTTCQRKLLGYDRVVLILATAKSDAVLDRAKERIVEVLRRQHRIKSGEPDDFDVSSVREMAELAQILTATLQILVGIIASISLVVGGVGIMNIMLVSVTERTREIGIRMAVGATPGDILTQFLLEAVVLSLGGGLIGILLGVGGAAALAWIAGWPLSIAPGMVLLASAVSAGIGVFFGYYPAGKAARLDPIEALRYE
jgi:putative ABC transport system permease protein